MNKAQELEVESGGELLKPSVSFMDLVIFITFYQNHFHLDNLGNCKRELDEEPG